MFLKVGRGIAGEMARLTAARRLIILAFMDTTISHGTRLLLRLEGLLVVAVAAALYAGTGAGWGLFAALFLVPDLSLLGYLAGPRAGAAAYNAAHTSVGPLLLGAAAWLGLLPSGALPLALIWAAHIGLDRALGYGLKLGAGFRHTHLGLVGRARATT